METTSESSSGQVNFDWVEWHKAQEEERLREEKVLLDLVGRYYTNLFSGDYGNLGYPLFELGKLGLTWLNETTLIHEKGYMFRIVSCLDNLSKYDLWLSNGIDSKKLGTASFDELLEKAINYALSNPSSFRELNALRRDYLEGKD